MASKWHTVAFSLITPSTPKITELFFKLILMTKTYLHSIAFSMRLLAFDSFLGRLAGLDITCPPVDAAVDNDPADLVTR